MFGRPGALLGRVAASLALLLFGALAVASGLDRMSLQAPGLARLIPSAMRAQASRSAAGLALIRGQSEQAVAQAREAVEADPLHPSSTALLGAAYLSSGDTARAEAAFRVAARFGWREPATQLYWYEAALQSGDMPRAVERADALLRTRPDFPNTNEMLAPLESSAAGRAALIQRLADRPAWLNGYLRADPSVGDEILDRRSVVLAQLAAAGTPLGCETVTPFVKGALERGARRQAESVWLGHCPGAALTGGLADGDFEQFGPDEDSPFGWRSQLSGDVTLRVVETQPDDHALQMRNQAAVSRLVLRQALSLEPGTYRLSGKVAPGRIAASLGCDQAPAVPAGVRGEIGDEGQLLRVEPCSRLELGLWLRPGSEDTELDDLELVKVG